jgi:site-specific recombinase XerD
VFITVEKMMNDQVRFNRLYQRHINELTLQGKSQKTIEMYSRSLRRLAQYFDVCPDGLTTEQLKQYFLALVESHSWSSVKIDRNAFQFFYKHVLNKEWTWIDIVKPPKVQPLQDVLAIAELASIINATRKLSYQVYFLTTYSLGLRLSEALQLRVADIDGTLMRVHLRRCKYNKHRFVPLPLLTLKALRRYWATHRHDELIFPGGKPPHFRQGKSLHMDKGGVQKAIKIVAKECGIAKNVHVHTLRHSIATHLLEAGVSLRSIQVFLGHSSPVTTAKYTRMTEQAEQNSALMLNALVDQLAIEWVKP